MTIISIKTENNADSTRIELSDGSIFSFKLNYLPPMCIDEDLYTPGAAEGREINTDEEEAFRFASACLRAEKAALQLIARAEQNIFSLSRKLEKRGHDSACTRTVIAHICELGLLDDRRYARLWLESHINRRASSPRRLLAALCNRGIDRDDADTALKAALDDETEGQLLKRYVQRLQRRQSSGDDTDTRRSLRYMLKNEGFSSAAIQWFFEESTTPP